ncbi:hypothetical protein PENDEC_c004G04331 [Penicillium decumbens]|uniref:Uncharacterized protein n=1 Tax=Penicillium decumbens TaxID=69771 RepID=A0A1V6PHM3_PENDC|nr:hypothetical protein PENDEC_c004G04331 [Penicillium decumbens]
MTTDLWPTVREKKYSLSHRLFHQLCEPHMEEPDRECIIDEKRKSSNYDSEVHKWFTDIRIYLDVALDTIRGDTAGLLRVERFKNWFEDGDTWKSAYEEQFDFDLRNHWDVVSKYDPFLNKARWRHGMLLIAHHAIHAPMDDKELMNLFYKAPKRKIYTTWDSARWSEAMPHGIDIPQGDMQPNLSHWHIYLDYKAWIGKKMISQ